MNVCPDLDETRKPCLHYLKDGFCSRANHFRCIEFIRRKNPIVSYSSDGLWRKCRRAFWFNYIMGYQGLVVLYPLIAGSIWHTYAAWVHSGDKGYLIKAERLMDEVDAEANNDIKLIPVIVNVYADLYGALQGMPEQAKTVFHEGYIVKSIVDLLVYDAGGKEYEEIYDWKYTGSPDYYTFFTTEYQAGLYLLQYPTVQSITYRCVRKVQLRQGKNEEWDKFISRVKVDLRKRKKWYFIDKKFYRSEYNFDRIEGELKASADEIRENIDKGIGFFRQNRDACYFAPTKQWCEFLPCCEGDVTPDKLPELYQKVNVEDKLDETS